MRALIAVLTVLVLMLQYQLWIAPDGVRQLHQLRSAVAGQEKENRELRRRNQGLEAEVEDLRQGLDAVEARARSELGMIREGETFYQVVDDQPDDEHE